MKSHDDRAARLLTSGQRDQQLKAVYHDYRKKEANYHESTDGGLIMIVWLKTISGVSNLVLLYYVNNKTTTRRSENIMSMLNNITITPLEPIPGTAKSFYGKATVIDESDGIGSHHVLVSYTTKVLREDDGVITRYDFNGDEAYVFSRTTCRHAQAFVDRYGRRSKSLDSASRLKIMANYPVYKD